jgi:hypothetical protein
MSPKAGQPLRRTAEAVQRIESRRPASGRPTVNRQRNGVSRSEFDEMRRAFDETRRTLDECCRNLNIQFQRIAQLQAEFDHIRRAWVKMRAPRSST